MKRPINTKFILKSESPAGGRLGEIRFGKNGLIQTPVLFPAICIMTGPPGFGRNGAHYKYIKRHMCRDWKFNHFLTEILHFTDYMGTNESLGRWTQKTFQTWVNEMMSGGKIEPGAKEGDQGRRDDFDYNRSEKPYETCFFLDSGGFKLLSNSDFSIEKYGYPTTPKSILELQTKMGGDIIASLDYPLPPVEYDPKTLRDLQNKSINNAINLLRSLSNRKRNEPKPLAYFAVHGVDYETSRKYTARLLKRLDREKSKYQNFGFAIGSLVPRRSNRALIANIVKAVKDAIHDHLNGLYCNKPIHAFGMSGDIVPTLAYLGVDTFDSNSFVQHGKNIRYLIAHSREFSTIRETRNLLEITKSDLLNCNCLACKKYIRYLEAFKKLSAMKAQNHHKISGIGRNLIKSEIYAFLALHALEIERREFNTIREKILKNKLRRYVLEYAAKTNKHGALTRAYEAATGEIVERPHVRKVSISLTRNSFTIPDTYKPTETKEILLLIPCTKDKPYKNSRSHEAVRSALHKDQRIHIVTISGLYGPVPEEFEDEPEILKYDYMLSPQATEQAEFVQERIVKYLKVYGNSYRQIFGYVTVRAYREVVRKAFKKYGRGILLPKKPKERTSKEFLKRENIKEMREEIGIHLIDATFLRKQLELNFS